MTYSIATVAFLNSLPLVEWFGPGAPGSDRADLSSDLPSRLPRRLADGSADVALVPAVEILRGCSAGVLGGTGIACLGPVDSVKLFHRGPVAGLRRVAVDRGSRTSVALLTVLLAEAHGIDPAMNEVEPVTGTVPGVGEAVLVIGDRCFAYDRWRREEGASAGVEALDLGQAWLDMTGLPFVFAAWAAAPGFPGRAGAAGVRELGDLLVTAREYGLARLPELAAREAARGSLGPGGEATPAALEYYFSHSLRYRLGEDELAGLRHFRDLCVKHGLVAPTGGPILL